MSEHIELTEPCGLLTVPGVREYVCRLEPVGEDTVNVTVCAPTEPIVRCRDCRHYREHAWFGIKGTPLGTDVEHACMFFSDGVKVEPDGFCSWACRREQ